MDTEDRQEVHPAIGSKGAFSPPRRNVNEHDLGNHQVMLLSQMLQKEHAIQGTVGQPMGAFHMDGHDLEDPQGVPDSPRLSVNGRDSRNARISIRDIIRKKILNFCRGLFRVNGQNSEDPQALPDRVEGELPAAGQEVQSENHNTFVMMLGNATILMGTKVASPMGFLDTSVLQVSTTLMSVSLVLCLFAVVLGMLLERTPSAICPVRGFKVCIALILVVGVLLYPAA